MPSLSRMEKYSPLLHQPDLNEDLDWMRRAIEIGAKSRDPSTQNGAVLVHRPELAVSNGMPPPTKCSLMGEGYNHLLANEDIDINWQRPRKYHLVQHAERDAIYNAFRSRAFSLNNWANSILYSPWAACSDCAKTIIGMGITEVVTLPRPEALSGSPWAESVEVADEMLTMAGVRLRILDLASTTPTLRFEGQQRRWL